MKKDDSQFGCDGKFPMVEIQVDEAGPHAPTNLAKATIRWAAGDESVGWGRDEDLQTARSKALGEAVERRAFRERVPMKHCRQDELPNSIGPAAIIRYSPKQYATLGFPYKPFDPNGRHWWVQGHSLPGGGAIWILADCVLAATVFDDDYRRGLYTSSSSSGCASGLAHEDAMLRGALELVERDAFMRHWLDQSSGNAVRLETLPRPLFERVAQLQGHGLEVSIRCLGRGVYPSWFVAAQHQDLCFTVCGSGTSLHPEQGLASALDELEAGVLPNLLLQDERPIIKPEQVVTPEDHAKLYATPHYYQKADPFLNTTDADVSWSTAAALFVGSAAKFFEHLCAQGLDVHWVDLTLSQASHLVDGQSVYSVRVVIPGLVPIAFGWNRLPLGMVEKIDPVSSLIHPFA